MQNVSTMIRRPVPIGTAAAGGLLAFVAGLAIAVGTPVVVAGLTTSHGSNAPVSAQAAGGEQIAHNRSEANLDLSMSVGGEQIAHDRSEKDLASR